MAVGGLERRRAPERNRPEEELVEDHAERIDVGLGAGTCPLRRARLLGGHVIRSPDGEPGERERESAALAADPEVRDLHELAPLLQEQEQVRGLQIAMDDPLLVDRVEPLCHVARDRASPALVERPLGAEVAREVQEPLPVLPRPARRELEREELIAPVLAVVEVAHDVPVLEEARPHDLRLEAPDRLLGARELDGEELECDAAARVVGLVDVGHASRGDEAHDPEAAVDELARGEAAPGDEGVAAHVEPAGREAAGLLLEEVHDAAPGVLRLLRVGIFERVAGRRDGVDPALLRVARREQEELGVVPARLAARLDDARVEKEELLLAAAREVDAALLEGSIGRDRDLRERRGVTAVERRLPAREVALLLLELARDDEPVEAERRQGREDARDRALELARPLVLLLVDDVVPDGDCLGEARVETSVEEEGRDLGVERRGRDGRLAAAGDGVAEEPEPPPVGQRLPVERLEPGPRLGGARLLGPREEVAEREEREVLDRDPREVSDRERLLRVGTRRDAREGARDGRGIPGLDERAGARRLEGIVLGAHHQGSWSAASTVAASSGLPSARKEASAVSRRPAPSAPCVSFLHRR